MEEQLHCRVYKIFALDPDDDACYIGSTTASMRQRIAKHKLCCRTGRDLKIYRYIRDNGGWDAFTYEILESKLVSSKAEQFACEQEFMDLLEPSLNERAAYLTEEQRIAADKRNRKIYYETHKEVILAKQKIYQEENKESLKIKSKEWRERNAETLKAKKKIYRESHKEEQKARHAAWKKGKEAHLKEYKRQYYLKNRDKQKVRDKANYQQKKAAMLEKVQCECGAMVGRSYLKKHQKTKKHLKNL